MTSTVVDRISTRTRAISIAPFALLFVLFACTWGQRFGYVLNTNDENANQASMPLFAPYLALLMLIKGDAIRVDLRRLTLYLIAMIAIFATVIVTPKPFSALSLFDLAAMYLPFIFVVPMTQADVKRVFNGYCWMLMPLAVIAIAQSILQIVGMGLPDDILADYVPKQFLLTGFNYDAVLNYESQWARSNALFFLEPSFVSQFMAVGVIIDVLWLKKWWRAGLFVGGSLASLSGTGMIALLAFVIVYVYERRQYWVLLLAALVAIGAVFVPPDTILGQYIGRINEFADPGSSAYMRFIAPWLAVADALRSDTMIWLFGHGPGFTRVFQEQLSYGFLDAPISKMLIEYGLIGCIPFAVFITTVIFDRSPGIVLACVFFVIYNFLSSNLLSPHIVFFMWALNSAFYVPPEQQAEIATA